MTARRLPVLLVITAGLAVARLWMVHDAAATEIVEPVTRSILSGAATTPMPQPSATSASTPAAPSLRPPATGSSAVDAIGNPFAARPAPQPVAPPPAPVAFVQPPAPDPLQSFHVIGTVDDQGAPGVFVDTPSGVELARVGEVLGGEFKVKAVARQGLIVEQIASKREFTLSIPLGGTP